MPSVTVHTTPAFSPTSMRPSGRKPIAIGVSRLAPAAAASTVNTAGRTAAGPCFARKAAGGWSSPKGEIEAGEAPLAVACREFHEETGQPADACRRRAGFRPLGEVRQRGGKIVEAWAFEGEWPAGAGVLS